MIRLIKPYISFEEVEKDFKNIFNSGIFTKGQYVSEFKEELKKYTGAKHAFLTTSATTALSTCLKLLEITKGDEVIVSDFSFPASANVIEDVGAIPIFADVSLETFNMLPSELEKKITKKTKAVIFVDSFGNPSGLIEIKEICNKYNVPLIEDAACAIGSSIEGIKVGNISDLTCFSFHPRKLLTTGEGGAILTNNEEYAKKLSVKLNHGANGLEFEDFGYNFRLPELQCAMGIVQLSKLDNIVESRIAIKTKYEKLLIVARLISQQKHDNVKHNAQSVVFKSGGNVKINELIKQLKLDGIEATIGTYSLSNCKYYKGKYNNVQKNSKWLFENTITLPSYQEVEVEFITKFVNEYLNKVDVGIS
jgi:dTDP-4-amino-4,6-dideoxygalactose transaminase